MAKKKEKTESAGRRTLTLKNGRQYEILFEDTKYYRCEGAQFRKNNPNIEHVDKEVKNDAEC